MCGRRSSTRCVQRAACPHPSAPLPRCSSLFLSSQYNGVWHCVVGRNFGSYVTHEAEHHIYFYIGQTAVLLFKTG